MIPLKVLVLPAAVNVRVPVRVVGPDRVTAAPASNAPPVRVTFPPRVTALVAERPVVALGLIVPPEIVNIPVPKALFAANDNVPALNANPPSYVLAPLSVTVPLVVFVAETPVPAKIELDVPLRKS